MYERHLHYYCHMSILTDARKFVGTAIIETEGSFYVWKTFFTFWSFSCLEEKWASVLHKKQSITKKNPKFSSNIYNKGIIRSTIIELNWVQWFKINILKLKIGLKTIIFRIFIPSAGLPTILFVFVKVKDTKLLNSTFNQRGKKSVKVI